MSYVLINDNLNINQMNSKILKLIKRINCLETDLIKYKLLSNYYQKYFDYFNEINETIETNNNLLDLKNKIKAINECQKSCSVSIEKLNKLQSNQSNYQSLARIELIEYNHHLSDEQVLDYKSDETNQSNDETTDENSDLILTEIEIAENNDGLSDGQVFDNESDVLYDPSDDETTDGSIDEYIEQNSGHPCDWKGCNAILKSVKLLKMHTNRHSGTYACDWDGCQYVGPNNKCLNSHKRSHSEDKPYKCSLNECGSLFKHETTLLNHQLVAHPQEFDHIDWIHCPESGCNYKTKSKINTKVHEKRHTRPYVCAECHKRYGDRSSLRKHLKTHSSEPRLKIACEWYGCEKLFCNNKYMRDHMNTHTLELNHSCDWPGCDKTFLTKFCLNGHLARHRGIGQYKCPHSDCDYNTRDNTRYKSHLKKHENKIKA